MTGVAHMPDMQNFCLQLRKGTDLPFHVLESDVRTFYDVGWPTEGHVMTRLSRYYFYLRSELERTFLI
jgi:hypothetical protein